MQSFSDEDRWALRQAQMLIAEVRGRLPDRAAARSLLQVADAIDAVIDPPAPPPPIHFSL